MGHVAPKSSVSKFEVGDRVQANGEPDDWDIGTVEKVLDWEGYDGVSYYVRFDVSGVKCVDEASLHLVWRRPAHAAATADDPVHHPSHYQLPSGIEVIDITRHESYLRGNILKYVLRAPHKGNELQDLEKARQYLDWEIERVRG